MKSGLICHLGTIEDFHALYLDKVESPLSKPTERSWVGKKLDFHSTALGKAFLAWKTDGELRLYLDQLELAQYTPKTITDRNLQTRQQAFWRLFFLPVCRVQRHFHENCFRLEISAAQFKTSTFYSIESGLSI